MGAPYLLRPGALRRWDKYHIFTIQNAIKSDYVKMIDRIAHRKMLVIYHFVVVFSGWESGKELSLKEASLTAS